MQELITKYQIRIEFWKIPQEGWNLEPLNTKLLKVFNKKIYKKHN